MLYMLYSVYYTSTNIRYTQHTWMRDDVSSTPYIYKLYLREKMPPHNEAPLSYICMRLLAKYRKLLATLFRAHAKKKKSYYLSFLLL